MVGFLREGERVTGVVARDAHTGEEIKVRAKQVINCTGVWTDDIQNMVGERGKFHVRASKGVHLLIPRDRLQLDTGLILRTEKSVLFVIPWGRHWIVGTTDTDWELDRAHPAASRSDIDYIFERVNKVLREPLTHEDVEGVYAGLRPLLSHESESTSKLSREHTVAVPVPGLVAVAGGKYTTYRVMAKDAVDAAVRSMEMRVPPSVTHETPLVGADGYFALRNRKEALAAETGLHPARIEHLLNRFGSRIFELTAEIAERPGAGRAAARRRRLPRRRGAPRGHPRGRPAPRGRAHPPHPDLDRGLGPRPGERRAGGATDGGRPRLGPGHGRPGGRHLPPPRRRRARVAGAARRPGRRRGADERPGRASRFAAGRAIAAGLLSSVGPPLTARRAVRRYCQGVVRRPAAPG